MSAHSVKSRKLAVLAIPWLALLAFAACSPVSSAPPGGTGGSVLGTGGGTPGVGGGLASGGASAAGGTPGVGGATSTGGGTATGGGGSAAGGATASGGATGSGAATGSGGTVSTECPPLPDLPEGNALTYYNEKLPSPFEFYDGTPVTSVAQWECRRKEILHMAAKYLYAPVPPEPDSTTGTVSGSSVTMNVTAGGNQESFTATINGSGNAIVFDTGSGILPGTNKTLSFGSGYVGKIESLFGISGVVTNIANGWMIDRVMDVLEANPGTHDPTKIAVSGCSGCGKAAFQVGAFSRVPLTIIVESGGGGAASLRQAEWFRHGDGQDGYQCVDQGQTVYPQGIDNLENSGACTPWVSSAAQWVRSAPAKVYNLPFDMHLLLAAIAPRYLLHFSNNHGVNSWCHLGGTCEALSAYAAKSVWRALGVPERMGFHMYSATHCSKPAAATALATEFFNRMNGDMNADTDVMDIMENGVQQPVSEWDAMWIDWDMNTVLAQ